MKLDMPVPLEKLLWFQEKLGLAEHDLKLFSIYRDIFLKEKENFANKLCRHFLEIPETRVILESERRRDRLKKVWTQWFELLFQGRFDEAVYTCIWRSGLRHVEINIDKRFINLAYAFVRQYCQDIARSEIPVEQQESFLTAMDKIVDFCVLVETHAYVSATTRCDMEVVKGISHQVRNPLTVIGGNIMRLQRDINPHSPMHKTYETIMLENKRLEAMVRDASVYSDMFQKEPVFSNVALEGVIADALISLRDNLDRKKIHLEIHLDPEHPMIQGDAKDLETMFYYLLQNSIEAADPGNPHVRISSRAVDEESPLLQIEIFNTGNPPSPQDMGDIFVPFYSSKPYGTGFGLPIAQLAARKNLGDLSLEPMPGEGTTCIVQLPLAAHDQPGKGR